MGSQLGMAIWRTSTGKYRIGKEIMDFRASGNYDKAVYFAQFNIQ